MFYELFVELRNIHIFTIHSIVGCSYSSLIYDIFVVMRSCYGLVLSWIYIVELIVSFTI